MEHGPTEVAETNEIKAIRKVLQIFMIIRGYAPRITVAAAAAYFLIVLRTMDRTKWDVPTNGDVAKLLNLTPSGASRVLAALTSQGRSRADDSDSHSVGGYGLVETNDWVKGKRIDAFVLTENGRACAKNVMQTILETDDISFAPHDMTSLIKLLLAGDS